MNDISLNLSEGNENEEKENRIEKLVNKNAGDNRLKNLYENVGTRVSKLREINDNYEIKIKEQENEIKKLDEQIKEKRYILEHDMRGQGGKKNEEQIKKIGVYHMSSDQKNMEIKKPKEEVIFSGIVGGNTEKPSKQVSSYHEPETVPQPKIETKPEPESKESEKEFNLSGQIYPIDQSNENITIPKE